ncbi:hypothetical protein J8273_7326 [Carpediemonas membranifera]|uniref:Uncharacterized protein n=1 Tax=Carpediemonas membranifera TaxID=201153 RepID=A0A8J6B1J6_9EUKA|nr:hypothetical protein J8273_7326 [Carpediemonas membranifera]|eukprot:KAG9391052.1 hypothetical protein J8273_7326 [Carpediemonas membranifera]
MATPELLRVSDILHSLTINDERVSQAIKLIDDVVSEKKPKSIRSMSHRRTGSASSSGEIRQHIIDTVSTYTPVQPSSFVDHGPVSPKSRNSTDLRRIAASRITSQGTPLVNSPSLASFSSLSASPGTPASAAPRKFRYIQPVSVDEVRALPPYMSGSISASELNRAILRLNEDEVTEGTTQDRAAMAQTVSKAIPDPKRTPKVMRALHRLGRLEPETLAEQSGQPSPAQQFANE